MMDGKPQNIRLLRLKCCSWEVSDLWNCTLAEILMVKPMDLGGLHARNLPKSRFPLSVSEGVGGGRVSAVSFRGLSEDAFEAILRTCLEHHYLLHFSHFRPTLGLTLDTSSRSKGWSKITQSRLRTQMVMKVVQMVIKIVLMTPKVTSKDPKLAPNGVPKCSGSPQNFQKRRRNDHGNSNCALATFNSWNDYTNEF